MAVNTEFKQDLLQFIENYADQKRLTKTDALDTLHGVVTEDLADSDDHTFDFEEIDQDADALDGTDSD